MQRHRLPNRTSCQLRFETLEDRRLLTTFGSPESPLPVDNVLRYAPSALRGWLGEEFVSAPKKHSGLTYNRYLNDGKSLSDQEVVAYVYEDPVSGLHPTHAFSKQACATWAVDTHCVTHEYGSNTHANQKQLLLDHGNTIESSETVAFPVSQSTTYDVTVFGVVVDTIQITSTAIEQRTAFLHYDDVAGVPGPGRTLWTGRGILQSTQEGKLSHLLEAEAEHNSKLSHPLPGETARGSILSDGRHIYFEGRDEFFKRVDEHDGLGLNTPLYTSKEVIDWEARELTDRIQYNSSRNPFESVVVNEPGISVIYQRNESLYFERLVPGQPFFFTEDQFYAGQNDQAVNSFQIFGIHPGMNGSEAAVVGFSLANDDPTIIDIKEDRKQSFEIVTLNDQDLIIGHYSSVTLTLDEHGSDDSLRIAYPDGKPRGSVRFDGGGGQDHATIVTDDVAVSLHDFVDIERVSVESNATIQVSPFADPSSNVVIDAKLEQMNFHLKDSWRVTGAKNVDGEQYVTLSFGKFKTVHVPHESKWTNPLNELDVSRDGLVSPIDALLGINYLNDNPGKDLPAHAIGELPLQIDTSQDGIASPVDVLLIINELNRISNEGEAEPLVTASNPPLAQEKLFTPTPLLHATELTQNDTIPMLEPIDFIPGFQIDALRATQPASQTHSARAKETSWDDLERFSVETVDEFFAELE